MLVFALTSRERDLAYHLGRTIIPPGRVFPPFAREVVDRVERFLHEAGPALQRPFRAGLWTLETAALAARRRSIVRLADAELLTLLDGWAKGDVARRTLFRVVAMVLKASYYNDPGLFAQLGQEYRKPAVADEPARWLSQVTRGQDVHDDTDLEADVVVVGTGAGGAAAAAELAERGAAVVLLEEGEFHRRSAFSGRPFEMQRLMYRQKGLVFTFGNTAIFVPVGVAVGGTTTINSGTCIRPPRKTLRRWRDEYGLTEFTPQMLEPYLRRVEAVYRVTPAEMKHVGKNGEIVARGAQALGWSHGPLPRNAPDCDGQGVCAFGCPTDAKRSTNVSYVPRALEANAGLFTGTKAEEILFEGRRAVGVRARSVHTGKTLTVRARIVVIACGAFHTPLLLMRHKLGDSSGALGKNLSIHPAGWVGAFVDEPVNGQKSIPQGYVIDEFKDEGIVLEGAWLPMDVAALINPHIGWRLQRDMESFDRLATFGLMVQDTSRGAVRPGAEGEPFITYWLNREDVRRIRRGAELLCRVYLAAGAREIVAPIHGWKPVRSLRDLDENRRRSVHAWDLDISAYHPLGTCMMGGDRKKYVTNPYGELYDAENLFICDGSVVPPGLGVNPQITISALATRTADYIADRLQRVGEL
ncbi:MAG: FAD-binding protein [Myxococcales bacterium]|nr:MAG: FAD-binding protein [Myxococcales bacterium]